MSLFSGIKFSSDQAKALASSSASVSSSTNPTPASAATPTTTKPTGEWSAALKFAPRLNKPKTVPPRPAGFSSVNQPPSSGDVSVPTSSSTVVETKSDIVRTAEPKLNIPGGTASDDIILGPDGKALAKAPAMTLAAAGEKEWTSSAGGKGLKRDRGKNDGRKKKGKKKKQGIPQHIIPTFDPDEQYDPNRPNDLGEYQQYRKKLREEKRAQLAEERRKRAAGEGSSDDSSYYTDSEEEVAPRRDAPKLFAPPKAYSPPPVIRPQSQSELPPAAFYVAPSIQAASGDDAYARRLAMSQAASGEEAFARRQALSQTFSAPPPPPPPAFTPAPPEALPPPPPVPEEPAATPDTAVLSIPGFGSYLSPTVAPSPPMSTAPPPPPASAPTAAPQPDSEEFQKMLEERKKAAEAIAAKFKALAGIPSGPAGIGPASFVQQSDPEPVDGGGTFAERMMRKMGHKEGEGLGRHGTGILHALAAEHVTTAPTPPTLAPGQTLSKRQLAKQKAAAANAKNRKWVQAPNARGKIINANEDERARLERERLGEASRVVCLLGMVEGVDDVDEDLSDEIGEECSKYGIVERVVLHMVEPPPPDPADCLRIFIVFSGMAGAWRAIKELDGRFFGGRKIRALYFDETKFAAGDRDGELL